MIDKTEYVMHNKMQTHKPTSTSQLYFVKFLCYIPYNDQHLQQLYCLPKNSSNRHVILLLHRLLPILSEENNHCEENLANLSDASIVYDQPENVLSGIKHSGTTRL